MPIGSLPCPRSHIAAGCQCETLNRAAKCQRGRDPPGTRPRCDVLRAAASVQLGLDLADARVDERVAIGGAHLLAEHVARCGRGHRDRLIAHVAHGARLGAGDLVLGGLKPPRDRALDLVLGILGGLLGLLAGLRHDAVGLLLRFLLLALVARQHLLRLFPKLAGLVEIGPDPGGPLIELLPQQARHLEIDQNPHEQQERDQHHEIGVVERKERTGRGESRARGQRGGGGQGQLAHRTHPFIRALTAAVTLRPSAFWPIDATSSAVTSLATSLTASIAPARISAIFFSPSAVLALISASASSVARSRSSRIAALVSAMIFCASALASASACL